MYIRRSTAVLIAVALCGGPGCMTCPYTAFATSLKACHQPAHDIPSPVRQKVYLFAMGGYDLLDFGGLAGLRDRVAAAGFSKVYVAPRTHRDFFAAEIRRVAADDPQCRFVLLGLGSGAEEALNLAEGAAADQVPVAAVVLLDPRFTKGAGAAVPGVRTLALCPDRGGTGTPVLGAEAVAVPRVDYESVARSPATTRLVLELLGDAARTVGPVADPLVPQMLLRDMPHPTPRPADPGTNGEPPPGWDFLRNPDTASPTPVAPPVPKLRPAVLNPPRPVEPAPDAERNR